MCKTWKFLARVFVLAVLFRISSSQEDSTKESYETTTTESETSTNFVETSVSVTRSPELKKLLRVFTNRLEVTILAEDTERNQTKHLTDDFQIQMVKKMTDYRLQMVLHRNHSFGQNYNEKWLQCLNNKDKKIKELEEMYSENESVCVQGAHKEITQQKLAVKQIIKETRKWRKGYRYLHYLCKENNPNDKESAGACFVDYMQTDKYDETITRLLLLLASAQAQLKKQVDDTLENLGLCLQKSLSNYLEGVREVMVTLNKCYKRKLNAISAAAKAENVASCVMDFTKLSCTSQ